MFESELKLKEIEFIAGSTQTLEFTVYDKNDELLDLRGATITWYLSEIGNNDNPLVALTNPTSITNPSDGIVNIKINPTDTVGFTNGKYEHSLTITQQSGRILKPCYGFIRIKQA